RVVAPVLAGSSPAAPPNETLPAFGGFFFFLAFSGSSRFGFGGQKRSRRCKKAARLLANNFFTDELLTTDVCTGYSDGKEGRMFPQRHLQKMLRPSPPRPGGTESYDRTAAVG